MDYIWGKHDMDTNYKIYRCIYYEIPLEWWKWLNTWVNPYKNPNHDWLSVPYIWSSKFHNHAPLCRMFDSCTPSPDAETTPFNPHSVRASVPSYLWCLSTKFVTWRYTSCFVQETEHLLATLSAHHHIPWASVGEMGIWQQWRREHSSICVRDGKYFLLCISVKHWLLPGSSLPGVITQNIKYWCLSMHRHHPGHICYCWRVFLLELLVAVWAVRINRLWTHYLPYL